MCVRGRGVSSTSVRSRGSAGAMRVWNSRKPSG